MTDRSDASDSDHVVTAFLRYRGEVLLLRRSDAVGTYRGQWGGVSGFAEGQPDDQLLVEIREETGLEVSPADVVRSGRPVELDDPDLERSWVVHPYLVDVDTREIEVSEEHDAFEWVSPTAILASRFPADVATDVPDHEAWADRETVPALWTAYERVAPTVRSITADDTHGAAWLSIRALEVLRDRAGLLVSERAEYRADPAGEREELAALAGRLLEARPAMAVLRNRVNRVMGRAESEAGSGEGAADADAPAVLTVALETIDRAVDADEQAATTASDRIDGTVLTLSRSGTVLAALERAAPSRIYVAESRPAREGIDVAERLASVSTVDAPITVCTDAAIAHVLGREAVSRVVVGADAIQPDGSVVNKTGTRAAAIAADSAGVPVTVVAASDKISTREGVNLESGSREAVYDGEAAVDVVNPTFDVTPADCVAEIVTEDGVIEPSDVATVAEKLRALEGWRDQ
ncbi:NUDIX domain-containing protein [Natrarchaeobaculum aegyptiacum]|nr:NUDIX domain-containing protein [Natrarchaeobaculum aegyptiacum]